MPQVLTDQHNINFWNSSNLFVPTFTRLS